MVPKGGLEPPTGFPNTPPQKVGSHIALETGQHSLATLLLQNGYRLELERYAPLDLALRSRRWGLFDLLLDWGGDIRSVDVYTVLETYNADLYERFRASGYDLSHTQCSRAAYGLLGAGAEWGQGEEATLASAEDEARIDRDIGRGGVIASRLRRFSTRWV